MKGLIQVPKEASNIDRAQITTSEGNSEMTCAAL